MDNLKYQIKQLPIIRWIIIGLLCSLGVFAGKVYLISWQYYLALLFFVLMIFFMLFVRNIQLLILIFFLLLINTATIKHILPPRMLWLNVIYLIIAWLIDKIIEKKKFTSFKNIDNYLIVLFCSFWLWIALIAIIKINELHYISWFSSIVHVWICLFIFYIFYDYLSQNESNLKQFIFILNCIITFVSLRVIFSVLYKFINNETFYKNIGAGFGNPNSLGFFFMLLSPILFDKNILNRVKRSNLLLHLLAGVAIYFTFSRTSIICLIISFLFLYGKSNKLSKIIIITLVAGSIFFLSEYIFWGRSTLGLSITTIIEQRISAHRMGWSFFMENPFLGIGYGRYTTAQEYFNSHNTYLSILYQLGFLGFLIYIALHVALFYNFIKITSLTKNKLFKSLASGCTASFLALLFHGLAEDYGLLIPYQLSSITFFSYIFFSIPFAIKNLQLKELKK